MHCDEPGYEGFAIRVRHNITNDELLAFRKTQRDLRDFVTWWTEQYQEWITAHPGEDLPEDHPLNADTPRMREAACVCEYVVGWNAMGLLEVKDEQGQPTGELTEAPVPPPSEGGVAVFDLLDEAQRTWTIRRVMAGYLSGKGIRPSSAALPLTHAASDGPPDQK